MRIYIITEGTAQTGMGHLGRCSALYDAFCYRGFEPYFIVDGGEDAMAFLRGRNGSFFDWKEDAGKLREIIKGAEIAVVDSYLAGAGIYKTISDSVGTGVYIDDYCRIEYPEGIVVNGTVGAENNLYPVTGEIEYLTGGSYVMLRKEFWDAGAKIINDKVKNVLIVMGATDILNLVPDIVALLAGNYPEIKKHVIGSGMAEAEELSDSATFFYEALGADEMKILMDNCDMAISAAGQTSNELACCGVPALLFKVAANQENNIKGFKAAGYIHAESSLNSLLEDIKKSTPVSSRRKASLAGQNAVDGKGALRVADYALNKALLAGMTLRKASAGDMMFLFDLANDPLVRERSFNSAPIPLCGHKDWFEKILSSQSVLYISEIGREPMGQVRFDIKEGEVVANFSILEKYRGRGLASEILRKAVGRFMEENTSGMPLKAYIKDGNIPSRRAFEGADFAEVADGCWEFKN